MNNILVLEINEEDALFKKSWKFDENFYQDHEQKCFTQF